MARKSKYGSEERGAELEELMDTLEGLLERTKILYEQYFMGIQKIPPAQLHKDIERKIRELTQEQIRNTAMRFRLTTITQKFGSYSTYWKRTLQSIEQGRYTRDINRARRKAQRQGEDIPDELLNSMPKAMRDRIRRDRAKVAEVAERSEPDEAMIFDKVPEEQDTEGWDLQHLLDGLDDDKARPAPVKNQVYQIDDDDDPLDDRIDELFAAITDEPPKPAPKPAPRPAPAPPARTAPPPAAINRTPVPQPTQPAPAAQVRPPQPAALDRTPVPQPTQPARPQPAAIDRTPVPQARPPQPGAVPGVPGRPAAPPRAVPDIAARPAAPPTPRPATPPPAARPAAGAIPPPPGMTEAETRSLYEQYRQARQLVGGEDISYDRLKQKLNEQAPRIMQQYNAKGLQYDVVVKDDKVVLKASPKRGE